MSAPRFYCPPPLSSGATFELPPEAAHHASRVLRLRAGDAVQIFDGLGQALDAKISAIQGKRVLLHELQTCMDGTESPLRITLAQAMSSSEKMDWVMQKATELGVAEIHPVQTQRSVAKLTEARAEKRTAHWRGITVAASEQCGRNVLPQVHPPQEFGTWLDQARHLPGSKFILLPEGAAMLSRQLPPQGSATLLIGPEGGFSESEAQLAQQLGFIPIRLGARTLRTETAALAGIAALQTLWGDFC
ncbi:MAG: 16S rRNA (uracil(1498)-N(3))-methyltransferase [Sideroxydans sp.]|nr:16S rRNA (uracil(1498)-N(3))-methyltransferase [Sideroxydans sp.]